MADPALRSALFESYQDAARKSLSEKQFQQKLRRADPIRLAMNAELSAAAAAYRAQRDSLKEQATASRAQQQQAWRTLAEERARDWAQWRARFNVPERDPAKEQRHARLTDAFVSPAQAPSPSGEDVRTVRHALDQAARPATPEEQRAAEQARRDERLARQEARWKERSKERKERDRNRGGLER